MRTEVVTRPAIVVALLLFTFLPSPALADDKVAVWGEFIYTLPSKPGFAWTITGGLRSDEQEINGLFTSRVSTEAVFRLPRRWDFRGRFAAIGRDTQVGEDYSFDQRVQLLVRYPLFDLSGGNLEVRGGTFYERHFRGDSIDDFNVYRQRVEMSSDVRRHAPWLQQDFFFDHERGFFRVRTRVGLQWNLSNSRQLSLAYQFQYTQNRAGTWTPQHTAVIRYWIGSRFSARGR